MDMQSRSVLSSLNYKILSRVILVLLLVGVCYFYYDSLLKENRALNQKIEDLEQSMMSQIANGEVRRGRGVTMVPQETIDRYIEKMGQEESHAHQFDADDGLMFLKSR